MKKRLSFMLAIAVLTLSACNTPVVESLTSSEISLQTSSDISHTAEGPPEGELIDIAVGDGFTVFLTSQGNAYFKGSNISGVLGYSMPESIDNLALFEINEEIKGVYASNSNIVFLGESGMVYYVGYSFTEVFDMGGSKEIIYPARELGKIENAVDISLFDGGCHVLTSDGKVYAIGDNYFNTAGIDSNLLTEFTLVPFDEKIASISSSGAATFFLAESGELYVCGNIYSGYYEGISTPERLLSDVKSASGSFGAGIAITNDGATHIIDSNYYDENLELPKANFEKKFTRLSFNEKVDDVFRIAYNEVILHTETGEMYTLKSVRAMGDVLQQPQKLNIKIDDYERIISGKNEFYVLDKSGDWYYYDIKGDHTAQDGKAVLTPFIFEGEMVVEVTRELDPEKQWIVEFSKGYVDYYTPQEREQLATWKYSSPYALKCYVGESNFREYYWEAQGDAEYLPVDEATTIIDYFRHFELNRYEIEEIIRVENMRNEISSNDMISDEDIAYIFEELGIDIADESKTPPQMYYLSILNNYYEEIPMFGFPYGDTSIQKSMEEYTQNEIEHSIPTQMIIMAGIKNYYDWFESLDKANLEETYTIFNFISEFELTYHDVGEVIYSINNSDNPEIMINRYNRETRRKMYANAYEDY